MREWSEEQARLACAWLKLQWNKPDRHDYYLMSVVRSLEAGKGNEVALESLKLPFEFLTQEQREKARQEAEREEQEKERKHRENLKNVGLGMVLANSKVPITVRRVSKDGTKVLSEKVIDKDGKEIG